MRFFQWAVVLGLLVPCQVSFPACHERLAPTEVTVRAMNLADLSLLEDFPEPTPARAWKTAFHKFRMALIAVDSKNEAIGVVIGSRTDLGLEIERLQLRPDSRDRISVLNGLLRQFVTLASPEETIWAEIPEEDSRSTSALLAVGFESKAGQTRGGIKFREFNRLRNQNYQVLSDFHSRLLRELDDQPQYLIRRVREADLKTIGEIVRNENLDGFVDIDHNEDEELIVIHTFTQTVAAFVAFGESKNELKIRAILGPDRIAKETIVGALAAEAKSQGKRFLSITPHPRNTRFAEFFLNYGFFFKKKRPGELLLRVK